MIAYINGEFVPEEKALVSIHDRCFLYGDGLFETVLVANGRPFRLAQHMERMSRGAQYLNIPLPHTVKEIVKLGQELCRKNEVKDACLRVTLSRGVGERGYGVKGTEQPTLILALYPAEPLNPDDPIKWRLITSKHQVPTTSPVASFKHANKLLQVVAKTEAELAGADDAIMTNGANETAECASSSLLWVYRDTVYTPPTGRGALPGVTRAIVLELCQLLAIPTSKKVVKPSSLRNSEGIFVTLSTLGVVPVIAIDGEPVNESPIVDRIRLAYCDLVAKGA